MSVDKITKDPCFKVSVLLAVAVAVDKLFLNSEYSRKFLDSVENRLRGFYGTKQKK